MKITCHNKNKQTNKQIEKSQHKEDKSTETKTYVTQILEFYYKDFKAFTIKNASKSHFK